METNIYWSPLLQQWVGEVRQLPEHDLCAFYVEHREWLVVVSQVAEFVEGQRENICG